MQARCQLARESEWTCFKHVSHQGDTLHRCQIVQTLIESWVWSFDD